MQERDFLGLSVKKETSDEISESARERSLAIQWSSSSKDTALPQLLSFQSFQEEKPKTGFNSLESNGLVSITRTNAFESQKKRYSGVAQKNIIPESQSRRGISTYPTNFNDPLSIHLSFNSQTNVTVPPMNQSFIATSANPHPLAGIPMANPVHIVGNTHLRNAPVISTAPAQLTLFYAGSVCVFDNISTDKAQAIMLLAGNMPPSMNSTTIPAAPVPLSVPRCSGLDGLALSQNYGATLHSNYPMPVTISPSCGNNTADLKPAPAVLISSSNKSYEPLNLVNSSSVSSNTVPQFRRKSLARFLEKRRERLVIASPFVDKQAVDCSTPRAGSTSLSVNSSDSSPLPGIS